MKKINPVFYLAMFCLFYTNLIFAQTWKWAVGSQCPHCVLEGVGGVTVDRSGNIYGCTQPYLGLGAPSILWCSFGTDTVYNPDRFVVVSTDSNGKYRWEQTATGVPTMQKIAMDGNDNLYLFGNFAHIMSLGIYTIYGSSNESNAFCAKLNSAGNVIWLIKIADSSNCTGAVDKDGNIYVGGQFQASHITVGSSTLYNHTFSARNYDVYIAKLDSMGNPIWAQSYGGDSTDDLTQMEVSSKGNLYVSGTYFSPSVHFGSYGISYAGDRKNPYIFTAKLSNVGNINWVQFVATKGAIYLNNLAIDAWEHSYIIGGFLKSLHYGSDSLTNPWGPEKLFLFQYDSYGNTKWGRTLSYSANMMGRAVAPDLCGNIWASGTYYNPPTYTSVDNMYLLNYDTSGVLRDSTILPAGADDEYGMVADNKGNLIFCGDYLKDTVTFGHSTLIKPDSTGEALFFAKYKYPFFCATLETPTLKDLSPGISLYPNPATNECTITTNNAAIIKRVDIYDLTGRIIKTILPSTITATINTAAFPPGLYTCKILTDNNAIQIEKLLIAN